MVQGYTAYVIYHSLICLECQYAGHDKKYSEQEQ
jgi:hypothetical protein